MFLLTEDKVCSFWEALMWLHVKSSASLSGAARRVLNLAMPPPELPCQAPAAAPQAQGRPRGHRSLLVDVNFAEEFRLSFWMLKLRGCSPRLASFGTSNM